MLYKLMEEREDMKVKDWDSRFELLPRICALEKI